MEDKEKMIMYVYEAINYNLIFAIVIAVYLIIRMSTACIEAMTIVRGGID